MDPLDILEVEIEKHRAYIKNVYGFFGFGLWGVFMRETDELIGRCGLQSVEIGHNNEIELGYLIEPKYQRQGYAYESVKAVLQYAFEELLLNRVVAIIDIKNTNSIHLAIKIGMHLEKEIIFNKRACYLYVISNITSL